MTAVMTQPQSAETAGCRYPAWCNGICRLDNDSLLGERNHWSDPQIAVSAEYWDEGVGVELYGYEVRGTVDAVRVGLTITDELSSLASTTITPSQARELGNVLTGFRVTDFRHDPAVLWHDEVTYVEFHQPRARRHDEKPSRPSVEVSIREDANCAARRAQLELPSARKLGRYLIQAAAQADRSNAEFGLVAR